MVARSGGCCALSKRALRHRASPPSAAARAVAGGSVGRVPDVEIWAVPHVLPSGPLWRIQKAGAESFYQLSRARPQGVLFQTTHVRSYTLPVGEIFRLSVHWLALHRLVLLQSLAFRRPFFLN